MYWTPRRTVIIKQKIFYFVSTLIIVSNPKLQSLNFHLLTIPMTVL